MPELLYWNRLWCFKGTRQRDFVIYDFCFCPSYQATFLVIDGFTISALEVKQEIVLLFVEGVDS